MPVTSNDIANQAIILVGDNQPPITGEWPDFDDSTAGVALNAVYGAVVETIGRQFEWDFARKTVALTLSGNSAPFPWKVEYLYPTNGIEVWQVMPQTLPDPNNPIPINWTVANATIASVQQRVIHTDLANAQAVYNNNPNENTWDSVFREAVVRLLASYLGTGVAGRPDTAELMFKTAGGFTDTAKTRDS